MIMDFTVIMEFGAAAHQRRRRIIGSSDSASPTARSSAIDGPSTSAVPTPTAVQPHRRSMSARRRRSAASASAPLWNSSPSYSYAALTCEYPRSSR